MSRPVLSSRCMLLLRPYVYLCYLGKILFDWWKASVGQSTIFINYYLLIMVQLLNDGCLLILCCLNDLTTMISPYPEGMQVEGSPQPPRWASIHEQEQASLCAICAQREWIEADLSNDLISAMTTRQLATFHQLIQENLSSISPFIAWETCSSENSLFSVLFSL